MEKKGYWYLFFEGKTEVCEAFVFSFAQDTGIFSSKGKQKYAQQGIMAAHRILASQEVCEAQLRIGYWYLFFEGCAEKRYEHVSYAFCGPYLLGTFLISHYLLYPLLSIGYQTQASKGKQKHAKLLVSLFFLRIDKSQFLYAQQSFEGWYFFRKKDTSTYLFLVLRRTDTKLRIRVIIFS